MKRLTKIKLINWYTFTNETIDLNKNTLVTGENGSGKSTLMDAVQYVLTAGTCKFNKAADERSKRNIETYVRCKVSTETKEYLRDGDVTGYIALEFSDDKRIDIIGACIECVRGSKPSRIFFKITNKELIDELFINDKYIKIMNEFKNQDFVETFNQVTETQKMIKSVIGINDDRYFTLLSKALAFKPIDDINEFVNNFLLEEQNINLEALYQNIYNVRNLKKTIEEEEQKIQELEKLEKLNETYNKLNDNSNFYIWLKNKIKIDSISSKIKEINKDITTTKVKINLKISERDLLQEKINSLKDDLLNYKKSTENIEGYSLIDDLKQKIENINKELEDLKETYIRFNKRIKLEKNIDQEFRINKLNMVDSDTLLGYKSTIDELRIKLCTQKKDLVEKHKNVSERIKEIDEKLEKLYKKQNLYDERVIKLKEEINNVLKEKYPNDLIDIRPVCEYIEVNDEKYRNVLEGYLNTQKFDLVVEPKYFNDAIKIYEDFKKDNTVYGIGIIDVNRLKEKEIKSSSLYEKLDYKNEYARLYMAEILGSVICVDNVEDLRLNKISVTQTCMTYKNNVVRKINPKNYEDAFIGERSQEIQIEKFESALKDTNKLLNQINSELDKLQIKLNIIEKSNIDELIRDYKNYKLYETKQIEKKEKQEELKKFETNDLFIDILEEVNKKETEISKQESFHKEIMQMISNLTLKLEQLENLAAASNQEFDVLKINQIKDDNNYEERFMEYCDKNIDVLERQNSTNLNKTLIEIETNERHYNEIYNFDEIPNIENINKYLEMLYYMRERELKQYKDKCKDLEKTCEISFREDFINKISNYIENACDNIRKLNKNLKKHKFGREQYEFIFKPSPSHEKYYDIITSGKVYNTNTLFDEELSQKDRETMDDLFKIITTTYTDDTLNKVVEEYTDYRKYMSYDIKVTNEENDSYYFSKVAKEKSGGEIQTPCYVMIAASFDELRKNTIRDDSVGCLVLFDEAFNKMDDARINTLMEFYSKLNIQLIISTPPDKIASISPYVDTNLIILKENNVSYVDAITKEELDEL